MLFILCGCNGAGKTTAAYDVLTELNCKEFVNADKIALGISPFNPESVAREAGRYMLRRIDELLEREETFAIETTLSTRSYHQLVKRASQNGYAVVILYFWLNSPDLAVKRVAQRVSEGGHNVPEEDVRRRYFRGIANLFNIFMNSVDLWMIYDNSSIPRKLIARGGKDWKTKVVANSLFNQMKSYV